MIISEDYFRELDHDAHIWKFPAVPANFYFLNEDELKTAERFRFDEDRIRYSVGRQSLRLLLSIYLSTPPAEILIAEDSNRKPYIGQPHSDVHFNISHSGGWVLIALANTPIGVDIELEDEDFSYKEILQDHFSGEEQNFISESEDACKAFYYLWTRKEALTKAWGTGLQENLKSQSVLHSDMYTDPANRSWKLESFRIAQSYPAAIALSSEIGDTFLFEGAGNLLG